MSKISNALNMYFLILSRGKISISDIARELEVSPRIIKTYKEDLEKAGMYISSERGRYGGYYVDQQHYVNLFTISAEEMVALKMASENIRNGQYHYSGAFDRLCGKMIAAQEDCTDVSYHNKTAYRSPEIMKAEKSIWHSLNLAITKKNKVQITYKSLKEKGPEIRSRMVDPYGLFDYKGASYFYGYCHQAKAIRFFKLSRIINYEIVPDKFSFIRPFDFNEVLEKSIGIFNDEPMSIKLEIHYPCSEIVKESMIFPGQIITEIDEKTILFEAKMKGYTEIKAWILSMGSQVRVIRPRKLKKDILKESISVVNIYKKEAIPYETS